MRQKLLIILAILLQTNWSAACSCVGESTVKESIKTSDLVAVGIVISKEFVTVTDSEQVRLLKPNASEYNSFPYSHTIAKYQVVIGQRFKGQNTTDTITIYTGVGGGDCGNEFIVGNNYILYGSNKTFFGQINNNFEYPNGQNVYWTNICTRTQLFNDKELNEIIAETKAK